MKTSVKLRDDLWEAAKIRAARDRKDLADVINDALEIYLAISPQRQSVRGEHKPQQSKKGGATNAR